MLQASIEKLIPESKGKILIKDFSDLEKDFRAQKYSEEMIKDYLTTAGAVTDSTPKSTSVYLKFEALKNDRYEQINFKKSIEHEVKHALTGVMQNERVTSIYKNDVYKAHNQNKVFMEIFNLFEEQCPYKLKVKIKQAEITQNNMLKGLGVDSEKNLYEKFEKILDKLIKKEKSTGAFNLSSDKRSWKQFFNSLKNMSKDEKEAYQSAKRYREYSFSAGKLKIPTDAELRPLVYAEMEKFFNKKRIQVNKQIPKY